MKLICGVPYLSVREVAAQLGLNERSVTRMIRLKRLAAIRCGVPYFIKPEHLTEYLSGKGAANAQ